VKAGRKPKPRPGPRAAGVIYVRLTEEEKAELDAAADRDGLGSGPWLRSVGLRAARGSGVPDRKEER
jgi:hypothetical protein